MEQHEPRYSKLSWLRIFTKFVGNYYVKAVKEKKDTHVKRGSIVRNMHFFFYGIIFI